MATPEPRLLQYADIPAAVNITLDANEHDPLQRYVFDTPDSHNITAIRASRRVDFYSWYTGLVHRGTIWTLEDIASVVGYLVPERKKDTVDTLLEWIFPRGGLYKKVVLSKEQAKREKEAADKFKQATNEVLGPRLNSMLQVGIVCTAPAKQGHGYASTLVRVVTALADEQKRPTWLISSNVANEGFYNYLGFKTEKEILLGDDNPTWTEPPVVIALMVREYNGLS